MKLNFYDEYNKKLCTISAESKKHVKIYKYKNEYLNLINT